MVDLRKISQQIKVTDFNSYIKWLAALYQKAKAEDGSYSYALFSTALELGSSNANLVVNGKRKLTLKSAQKIAASLKLTTKQSNHLNALVSYEQATNSADREKFFQQILRVYSKKFNADSQRHLEFYSNWYNAAILELLRLPSSLDDPQWISNHLCPQISLPKAKASLELLLELKLIEHCPVKKRLVPCEDSISSGAEVPGIAIVRFHQQMIDLAKRSIDTVPYQDREISSLTIAVTNDKKAELKKRVLEFKKSIINDFSNIMDSDDVVQLNFQLFPLSNTKGDKSD